VSIVLALVTAALFGGADFAGGMATKRVSVLHVVFGAHLVGAVGAVLAALVMTGPLGWDELADDMALAAFGGLFGLAGVGLLYRRLAIGPMSVVAPVTAITAAVLPAAWGLLGGERLTSIGAFGLFAGLVAVLLVSWTTDDGPNGGSSPPVTPQVIIEALLAGAGFGAIFIAFDATDDAVAPWPVAGGRIFTSAVMVVIVVSLAARGSGPKRFVAVGEQGDRFRSLALVAAAGLGDTAANVTFIYATTDGGRLAVVSVLSALYPVGTVILARLILGERMTRPQRLGFVAAMTSAAALALG
jgi:uncharacterized membrane protein